MEARRSLGIDRERPADDDPVAAPARRAGQGCGYDAVARQIADMRVAGILDAAGILRLALETAVSGAVMALTTDAPRSP